ncbi:MAG: hypothetical protein JO360_03565 [Acidobacteria bacterium]|nr:hypothetical protein [Acidobacteriota bacterium]
MFRRLLNKKFIFLAACCAVVTALAIPATTRTGKADDLTGRELLSVTRVAHGGNEYRGLQFVTAKASGFVNVAPIAGVGLGTGGAAAAVEVKLNLTDYQDVMGRRRLDVSATAPGAVALGPTFLVYTGSSGGGMYMGNEFRVSEAAASRHWGLMGFSTLNRAVDGSLVSARQRDEGNDYVVEVKFNPEDTVRYWINKNTFLIDRVVTRYNSRVLVEEERSDYRKVSCMMLPFRIVTKLSGQRLADLNVDSYDLQTAVPSARFTMAVVP